MTKWSELVLHDDFRLRMVAVRRAWAHEWRKEIKRQNTCWEKSYCEQLSAANFSAARERLKEVKECRSPITALPKEIVSLSL